MKLRQFLRRYTVEQWAVISVVVGVMCLIGYVLLFHGVPDASGIGEFNH